MELLSPYRTEIAHERRALQKVADFLSIPLDELWDEVVSEWDESGTMKASWLPRTFREGRALYTLTFPQGWWVDVTATETITAIDNHFSSARPTSKGANDGPLTLAHLTGDDRALTTTIAGMLREDIELDDGTLPLGIRFISKHGRPASGSGTCWAYWMREVDSGLSEPTQITNTSAIEEDSAAFKQALAFCKIKSR